MAARFKNEKAFTLVELLLGAVLATVVVGASATALVEVTRGFSRVQISNEIEQTASFVASKFEVEVANALEGVRVEDEGEGGSTLSFVGSEGRRIVYRVVIDDEDDDYGTLFRGVDGKFEPMNSVDGIKSVMVLCDGDCFEIVSENPTVVKTNLIFEPSGSGRVLGLMAARVASEGDGTSGIGARERKVSDLGVELRTTVVVRSSYSGSYSSSTSDCGRLGEPCCTDNSCDTDAIDLNGEPLICVAEGDSGVCRGCGDRFCSAEETCATCPADCGCTWPAECLESVCVDDWWCGVCIPDSSVTRRSDEAGYLCGFDGAGVSTGLTHCGDDCQADANPDPNFSSGAGGADNPNLDNCQDEVPHFKCNGSHCVPCEERDVDVWSTCVGDPGQCGNVGTQSGEACGTTFTRACNLSCDRGQKCVDTACRACDENDLVAKVCLPFEGECGGCTYSGVWSSACGGGTTSGVGSGFLSHEVCANPNSPMCEDTECVSCPPSAPVWWGGSECLECSPANVSVCDATEKLYCIDNSCVQCMNNSDCVVDLAKSGTKCVASQCVDCGASDVAGGAWGVCTGAPNACGTSVGTQEGDACGATFTQACGLTCPDGQRCDGNQCINCVVESWSTCTGAPNACGLIGTQTGNACNKEFTRTCNLSCEPGQKCVGTQCEACDVNWGSCVGPLGQCGSVGTRTGSACGKDDFSESCEITCSAGQQCNASKQCEDCPIDWGPCTGAPNRCGNVGTQTGNACGKTYTGTCDLEDTCASGKKCVGTNCVDCGESDVTAWGSCTGGSCGTGTQSGTAWACGGTGYANYSNPCNLGGCSAGQQCNASKQCENCPINWDLYPCVGTSNRCGWGGTQTATVCGKTYTQTCNLGDPCANGKKCVGTNCVSCGEVDVTSWGSCTGGSCGTGTQKGTAWACGGTGYANYSKSCSLGGCPAGQQCNSSKQCVDCPRSWGACTGASNRCGYGGTQTAIACGKTYTQPCNLGTSCGWLKKCVGTYCQWCSAADVTSWGTCYPDERRCGGYGTQSGYACGGAAFNRACKLSSSSSSGKAGWLCPYPFTCSNTYCVYSSSWGYRSISGR